MAFTELDDMTRKFMLRQFEGEEAGTPYRSNQLSAAGLGAFAELMRSAIEDPAGNEISLSAALGTPEYWEKGYVQQRKSGPVWVTINPEASATRLALTEFNTWYVAGLAHRLRDEGESTCEVYRADEPIGARAACTEYEGSVVAVELVIMSHRCRYWPAPGEPDRFMIPAAFNCHHTIRRVAI
ncbi:MAG: hypothetical protein QOI95_3101 [Acidimicrobiaceae bacterium]